MSPEALLTAPWAVSGHSNSSQCKAFSNCRRACAYSDAHNRIYCDLLGNIHLAYLACILASLQERGEILFCQHTHKGSSGVGRVNIYWPCNYFTHLFFEFVSGILNPIVTLPLHTFTTSVLLLSLWPKLTGCFSSPTIN